LTFKAYWLFRPAYPIAVLTLASLASLAPASSARADFFDGARRTFQTDIPCAFGGQPTSHTRTSCKSPGHPTKHATDKNRDGAAVRSDKTNELFNARPSSGR
jgi:hypothetical protein